MWRRRSPLLFFFQAQDSVSTSKKHNSPPVVPVLLKISRRLGQLELVVTTLELDSIYSDFCHWIKWDALAKFSDGISLDERLYQAGISLNFAQELFRQLLHYSHSTQSSVPYVCEHSWFRGRVPSYYDPYDGNCHNLMVLVTAYSAETDVDLTSPWDPRSMLPSCRL